MVIHRRKDKWDSFASKVEDLRKEVLEQEQETQETKSLSGKKTPSE